MEMGPPQKGGATLACIGLPIEVTALGNHSLKPDWRVVEDSKFVESFKQGTDRINVKDPQKSAR